MFSYNEKELFRVRMKFYKRTKECIVVSYEKGVRVTKNMEFPIISNYGFYYENTYTVEHPEYKIHNYIIEMSKYTYDYRMSDKRIGNELYLQIYSTLLNTLREEKIDKMFA